MDKITNKLFNVYMFNRELFQKLIKEKKAKDKRYTREKIAEDLGISSEYIYLILSGKREPSKKLIQKMADYFNVPVSSLLGLKEPEKPKEKTLEDIAWEMVNLYLEKTGQKVSDKTRRKMYEFTLYKLKQAEGDMEKVIKLLAG